ncbi:MAG TPA: MFS transporter [Anaerolineales bacterium]|nr:MFS transporter [Anaerolineales bacterium]
MLIHIPPAIRYRRFRLLWIGLVVSIAGSQMQTWALFWHIRTLTDQPIALGGVGLARIIPIVLFSLVGGAAADAVDRRKLLFITQVLMALVALSLAWLTFRDELALWSIYVLTAVQALALSFDTPARQALVPNLVPAKDLPSAFSLTSIGFQTGAIVGPALSGLIIAYLGQPYTYLINALTYLVVFWALAMMGPVEQQRGSDLQRGVSLAAIRDGIRFIFSHPIIFATMILDFFATFFSSANTLMPYVARDILRVGAIEYGWLSAAQSLGAVVAAGIASQFNQIRRQGMVFLWAVVAFGLATITFGLVRTFPLAMLALILIGASDSISTIIRNTIRQLQTPDHIRGRMVGINQIFFMGGPQLGEVEAGVVAQVFSVPLAIVSGGVGCLLAVAWIARRWPLLRQYNGDEPLFARAPAD